MIPGDFDLQALYAALDERRQKLGLTWAAASRQISVAGPVVSVRPTHHRRLLGLRRTVV